MKEEEIDGKINTLKMPERWILNELNELVKRVSYDLDNYHFADIAVSIYEFFWFKFCDWYIEISKIELNKKESPYRNTVQNVLAKVLKDSLIVMHAVVPFITEEIYQALPVSEKKESIMLETWPEVKSSYMYDTAEMTKLMNLIYAVRNLRGDLEVSPAEKSDVAADLKGHEGFLKENEEIIKSLAKVQVFIDEKRPGFISKEVKNAKNEIIGYIGINTDNLKDIERVIKNKQDALKKLENGVASVTAKLGKEDFVKHATEKTIAEEKEKLKRYEQDCVSLRLIIEALRAVKR
jgi:valyl-tRNA synthetase